MHNTSREAADSDAHRSTNAMLQSTGNPTLFDSRVACGHLGRNSVVSTACVGKVQPIKIRLGKQGALRKLPRCIGTHAKSEETATPMPCAPLVRWKLGRDMASNPSRRACPDTKYQNDLPGFCQGRLRLERGGKEACSSTTPCGIVSLLNLLAKRLPRVKHDVAPRKPEFTNPVGCLGPTSRSTVLAPMGSPILNASPVQ